MKNIISKYINVEKPRKRLTESDTYTNTCRHCGEKDIDLYDCETDQYWSDDGDRIVYHKCPNCGEPLEDIDFSGKGLEESDDNSSDDSIQVYMNTWKNYNSYGADLEAYGIKDGWMSLDDAIAFAKKYAEDEPFINDIENSPVEISEYDSLDKLKELKEYEDCDDKELVKAILQSGHTDDISEAISIADSGDYIWFPGVSTDAELAEAYIDMCGSLEDALGDRVSDYIDEQRYRDDIEDDVANLYMENNGLESIDDCYDEEHEEDFNAFLDEVVAEDIANGDLSNYFDYDAFGRDLGYDYTFVDDGAISIL